jgi:nucleotide-binding universal stress UspA family protein
MFRRILVPLDGSTRAEVALPVAARLAQAAGGTVVLLRVVNPLSELAAYYPPFDAELGKMLDAEVMTAQTYLENLVQRESLTTVRTEIAVPYGEVATLILAEAAARRIDLIVMCSHGYSGPRRWELGSMAEKVAHHAPVPVLVLHEDKPLPSLNARVGGSVRALVPLDGSTYAQAALAPAARLVAALSAPARGALHLARVVVPPGAGESTQSERDALMQQAQRSIGSTLESLREGPLASEVAGLNLSIGCSVIFDDDIAAGIIRLAEDGEPAGKTEGVDVSDAIAMATHGFGGQPLWEVSSVTERVLQATRLPLLIVRPHELADTDHPLRDETTYDELQKGEIL